MNPGELQKRIFNTISARAYSGATIIEKLSGLFNVSISDATQIFNGDRLLSFEQISELCAHFDFSLDQLFGVAPNQIVCTYGRHENYFEYLSEMAAKMAFVNEGKEKVIYVDSRLSINSRIWAMPNLSIFKHYVHLRDIKGYDQFLVTGKHSMTNMQSYLETGRQVFEQYKKVPLIEFWGSDTLNPTLEQIEYARQSGIFRKKTQVEVLYDELDQLVNQIQLEAEVGEKFTMGGKPAGDKFNYKVYISDYFVIENTVLAIVDKLKIVLIDFSSLSSLQTSDEKFGSYVLKEFEQHIQKSSLISTVNERDRNRFFNKLRNRIQAHRKMLWTQEI